MDEVRVETHPATIVPSVHRSQSIEACFPFKKCSILLLTLTFNNNKNTAQISHY